MAGPPAWRLNMARKTASRLEMRRMAEAAEARGEEIDDDDLPRKAKAKAKAPAKKTTRRTKEKVAPRRRLMWAVYNGNMKEEARFPYADRQAAEEKLAQLREKSSKKLFFIQPVKVPLGEEGAKIVRDEVVDTDDELPKMRGHRDAGDEEE
jgi:hypothetical protein